MKTNLKRIQRDIEALAKFNATPDNGLTRLSLTEPEQAARRYLKNELQALSLKVYEDAAGTIIGRLEGEDPSLPCIMIGSHFDSVKNGGHFDGPAGIVMGLEIIRTIVDEGIKLKYPLEFVGMIEEEGGRFGSGVFGSRAMARGIEYETLINMIDSEGVSMAEAFQAYGYNPKDILNAKRKPEEIKAFLELHIEQGPILEKEKLDVGIVEFVVGISECRIKLLGRPDHAGTTPMNMRQDPLIAASKLVQAVEGFANNLSDGTVATVGSLITKPGAFNIVASEVELTVDIRSKYQASIDSIKDSIEKMLKCFLENQGMTYEIHPLLDIKPVEMAKDIQKIMNTCARDNGISAKTMISGAGHDAMIMAEVTDVGLLFVPSRGGRSHSKEEWTDYDQLQKGIELLYHTVLEIGEVL